MGGGGSSPDYNSVSFNQDSFQSYLNSAEGQQYNSNGSGSRILQNSDQIYQQSSGHYSIGAVGGEDINGIYNNYLAWMNDQSNEQSTWQNYADLVAKQAGGEGQQTILGSALTPYQSILASQQGAGGLGNPASAAAIVPRRSGMGAP